MNNKFKYLGKDVTIFAHAKIVGQELISIGDGCMVDDFVWMWGNEKGIDIGRFCHITVGCIIQSGGLIKMGDFSGIGHRSVLLAGTDDYKGEGLIGLKMFGEENRNLQLKDIILEKHCHVGMGSLIMPGVTLGEGCSVGAGSLVTKDMPPWTLCYGSPCKPIKDKPKEKQLEQEKRFLEAYYAK